MQSNITQAIAIITIMFVLVCVFVIAYVLYFKNKKHLLQQENKAMSEAFAQSLLQSQVEVQETTFQHIGKELHDNVGQLLSSTKMLLGITEMKLNPVPDTLHTANETLSKAIQEIRTLSRSLDKSWLQQFSFMDNLNVELNRINAGGLIAASCNSNAALRMNAEEQIILFRIVQEAIQNAIKHGNPTNISISITENSNNLHVSISDNGCGLPANFNGMGTGNMKHRTKLFGGKIQWLNADTGGTIVNIHLPIK